MVLSQGEPGTKYQYHLSTSSFIPIGFAIVITIIIIFDSFLVFVLFILDLLLVTY